MKNQYKTLIGFIILFSSLAHLVRAQESKTLLNANYKVNQNTALSIDNQFGNIQISTWNKPDFSIKVTLNLSGLSEKEATKIKEKVSIEESVTNQEIKIKTNLNNGSFNNNKFGKKFEINYEVFIPDNHPLSLKNSFGNLAMQNYNGPINLVLEYGNLNIGELKELKLKLAFGNGTIESINKGDLAIEYADKFSITYVDYLELKSDFSKITINKANQIDLNSQYGQLTLGTINTLTGKSDFSGLKINRLENNLQLKTSYVSGTLEIAEIATNFQDINIKSEFSAISLLFESGQKVPFHIKTSFGKFKQPAYKINLSLRIEEDFEKEYKGTIGEGNLNGKVFVSTSYGNVSMNIK
jgi:hypothetical protein